MTNSNFPESIVESFFGSVFNTVEIGIALIDTDGVIQWVNQSMGEWFGPVEELIHAPCEKICQKKDEFCCINIIDHSKPKVVNQISHTSPDGITRFFDLTTSMIKNSPSDKYEFILMAQETTEIQRTKESLEQKESRFQRVIDSALAGIALTDIEGKVIYANQEARRLFGFDASEDLQGMEGINLFTDPQHPVIREFLEKLIEGEQLQNIEAFMKKKDGTPIFVRISATTLNDRVGEPPQLLVTFQDITESFRAEKIQEAVYQIASVAGSASGLEEIYPAIHKIIQGIMPAQNFYIALNRENKSIYFPYFVDEKDSLESNEVPYYDKTITAYLLRTGRSLLCTKEVSDQLEEEGQVDMAGTEPEIWLGAPLILNDEPIGVIAMQHYSDPDAYDTNDQRILEFVSTEVAKAIHNKYTENALLESEKRFRSIVEALPFGVHMYQLMPNNDLVLIAANESADKILGIRNIKMVGKTIEEAFPSLIGTDVPEAYRKAAAEGILWKTREINYQDEQIQGAYDVYAFQTSPNEMVALFHDISERIQTETALIASEKRFRSVVESSPIGIFIYQLTDDDALILLDSNPASDEILGNNSKEKIGEMLEETFPWVSGTEIPAIYRRIARSGGVWQNEDIQYEDDKITGGYEIFAFQIASRQVAMMVQDITNRLKNEEEIRSLNEELEERVAQRTDELQAANREMEAFAYSVSHDLRAPVRSIKGFSELLMKEMPGLDEGEIEDLLGRIYNSSIKMDELIDDLLSLSYLENQKMEIRSINLSKIVKNICQQLDSEYAEVEIKTKIKKTPKTRADSSMVTIMLTNLLTNAYKFTAGQPNPTITFGSKQHSGETTYYLKDNGIGFEMEYAEKIFAPFERLNPIEYEGTGIGLAIVRRVVQRHKGRIWAVSTVGEGTTFYFSFGTHEVIL